MSESGIENRKPHPNRTVRTLAHRVHVLTLPIENPMAVRRRTSYARANEFGVISADEIFEEFILTLEKSI